MDPPSAYALLDVARDRATRVDHGVLDPARDLADLDELIALHRPEMLALELVERVYPRRDKGGISADYATQLYRSGVAAGEIRAHARARGLRVETATAEEVRGALCGNQKASDDAVLRTVLLRVSGWPRPGKPGQRTSVNHERDAAICALYVGLRAQMPDRMRCAVKQKVTAAR